MEIHKNSVTMRISYEAMGMWDHRYIRNAELVSVTQPTEQEQADYEKAREALAYLKNSPYFVDGGPDDGATIEPPQPHREYKYTETEEEWRERCAKLSQEDF